MPSATEGGAVPVSDWYAALPLPALASDTDQGFLRLRRYIGTPPDMDQPPLADHIVCMHLGGAKRVHRWHEGRATVSDVEQGSLTIMPAAQSNRWRTLGPIDFVHLALPPALIDRVVVEEFGCDPRDIGIGDAVGLRAPLAEVVFGELVRAVESRQRVGRLYTESLTVTFVVALLHARKAVPAPKAIGGLGSQLRHVVDYMRGHLADDIGLAELTELTGVSRAHFYRAFRQSTQTTPARFMDRLRVERARELIAGGMSDADEIAEAIGVVGVERLSTLFKRYAGTTFHRYIRREK